MNDLTTSNTEPGIRFAAFLRGINVGGHRKIKMDELVRVFADAGMTDVRTIIASGNVLFTSDRTDIGTLTTSIEQALQDTFGFDVTVFLRTTAYLQDLVRLDPFGQIGDGDVKLYVTFLPEVAAHRSPLPFAVPGMGVTILAVHGAEIFTVSHKLPESPRYGDAGSFIAKTFGKVSTTRNWNTIVKMALD